ncbi:hypothetical protein HK099_005872 [Clydaea vesicula]|uniref:Uncharacterized protein n=1 Tax=Clydaea vesicula TaxID=447962 RepID=A0AAD5Y2P0_9FUNG|nr:hypothetical protein HK099_005872 [Clydaea vesicula]
MDYNTTNFDNSSIDDLTTVIQGDEITKQRWYNVILWTPFVAIPFFIIFIRVAKFSWKLYKSKQLGKETDFLRDPLAELGFTDNTNYSKQKQIKRIKKEQEQYKKWIQEKELQQKAGDTTLSDSEEGNVGIRQKADLYFMNFTKKTKKTWSDKLSPEAVRRYFSATKYGRIWMFFQVTATACAIINYILLTYQIQNDEKKAVKRMDLFLAVVFAVDYAIGLYTAEDRLKFYFHPSSLVDLLSIIPPFVYVFISESSPYIWFLGLLRILRASRILRTYRLVSFSETEEKRELTILGLTFINFLFLSASIINALEVLQGDNYKVDPTLKTWHDCLYYIMVTFSTIGFGDLTPKTIPSRILVMFLILVVVIFVPLQSNKLAELYGATNRYQRARYSASKNSAHVILTGIVTYSSIIDFCREYFANDPSGQVVILAMNPPTLEIRRILRHPFYKYRLFYLCGSALNTGDLNRCSASQATGIFLLNSETTTSNTSGDDDQLKVTRGADAEILMQTLVVKTNFPGLSIFTQVQDIRSQDLAEHCGCDRTLCIDELKMSILAKNCVVPGILTLIMNLVHTYQDTDESLEESWMQEYQAGATNQMHSFKFPPGLTNKSFSKVVSVIYNSYNVTVFSIIRKNNVIVNPGKEFIIKNDDIGVCILNGGDDVILRITLDYSDRNRELSDNNNVNISKENENITVLSPFNNTSVSTNILRSGIVNVADLSPTSVTSNLTLGDKVEINDNFETVSVNNGSTLKNHIIICGNMMARGVRNFVQTIRNGKSGSNIPIVCLMENVPSSMEGIWEDILKFEKIYIIKGTPLKKTNLLNAGIANCHRIVIFAAKSDVSTSDSIAIPDANSIFIVQMIQEEWPKIKFIVDLVNGSNARYFSIRDQNNNINNIRMQSILNNYSLSISDRLILYKKIRGHDEHGFLKKMILLTTGSKMKEVQKVEMGGGSNAEEFDKPTTKLLRNEASTYMKLESKEEAPINETFHKLEQEAELNETGLSPFPVYHFDKFFAAGMISTASFTHSILCQSYFRPFLIQMVKLLIKKVECITVPKNFIGKKYGDLFVNMIENDFVCLGLYRNSSKSNTNPLKGKEKFHWDSNEKKNLLPFVYTNTKLNEILKEDDVIFVVQKSNS